PRKKAGRPSRQKCEIRYQVRRNAPLQGPFVCGRTSVSEDVDGQWIRSISGAAGRRADRLAQPEDERRRGREPLDDQRRQRVACKLVDDIALPDEILLEFQRVQMRRVGGITGRWSLQHLAVDSTVRRMKGRIGV